MSTIGVMETYSHSSVTSLEPDAELSNEAINKQLQRMLETPIFNKSKRYSNLLRYVVEYSLEGHPEQLKERTIGMEVFNRKPDYDTSLDPVVRIAASEVRRRIAQYYYQPAHENELRIDLPSGTYSPEFHLPVNNAVESVVQPQFASAPTKSLKPAYIAIATLSCLVVFLVILLIEPWSKRTELDIFWEPIVSSPDPVLISVGRTFSPSQSSGQATSARLVGSLGLRDAAMLARVAGILNAKGTEYSIGNQFSTTLSDLRNGPVVLIGAFNNEWSTRLTSSMRYGFERSGNLRWIYDREDPAQRSWQVDMLSGETLSPSMEQDYALVSRTWDATMEQYVVIAGGLTSFGTMAASEFLSSKNYMTEISDMVSGNWEHKSLQVVIETKVVDGNSGPPRVVAAHVW